MKNRYLFYSIINIPTIEKKKMGWQNCCVLSCKSSKKQSPELRFFTTPAKEERRYEWIRLAGKNPNLISGRGRLFCENHFSVNIYYVQN